MATTQKPGVKIIRVLDPLMCVRCDFCYIADVKMTSGKRRKMFYCARKDCDQWITGEEVTQ